MILLLAHTPMQLMNAIILSKTEFAHKKCDLYYTENLMAQVEKMKNENVFHTMCLIDLNLKKAGSKNVLEKFSARMQNLLGLEQIKGELPTDPMGYCRICLSGINLRNIEFYYAIKSLNPQVRLSVYEEGTSEYCNMSGKDKGKILVSKIFFRRYYLEDCDSLYVHSPELVSLIWKHIEIKKIPDTARDPQVMHILKMVMGYEREVLSGCDGKYIFLEQAFYDEESERKQKEILDQLSQLAGPENIRIKLHPRSPAEKYGPEYEYLNVSCPFEIVAMYEQIEGMTFISIGSSAILNFKLMLNREPKIIMMNRLFGGQAGVSAFDQLVLRVQNACKERNLYIPETMDELKKCIHDQ